MCGRRRTKQERPTKNEPMANQRVLCPLPAIWDVTINDTSENKSQVLEIIPKNVSKR